MIKIFVYQMTNMAAGFVDVAEEDLQEFVLKL